jgi:hypothetical protein
VSIRLIHGSTYTLGFGHLAGDKNEGEKYIHFRQSGFLDWTCTTTIEPEGGKYSGLKNTKKKKCSVSIDDYLTDT